MAAPKIPTTIEELKSRMAQHNVSDEDLEKFQEELDDGDHDIESIKEDIGERDQSMLLDFFRDELYNENIYDIVKEIMDGTTYKGADTVYYKEDELQIYHDKKKHIKNKPETKTDEENKNDSCDEWEWNKNEEQSGEGTVILNAGLIIIPDEVITDPKYLENVKGITYILAYNNAKISPPRLSYSYIDFWFEYLNEEEPQYKQIMDDISYNEGPTYDYLMEHQPFDRILPVLEKVVDQIKHPILDSDKEKRAPQSYENDIDRFFKEQTPDFYKYVNDKDNILWSQLKKTCIIFKKNTNDCNFNIFELFINIQDIYDRILYNFNEFGLQFPHQITGRDYTKNDKEELLKTNHFASLLNEDDCRALNKTLVNFKDIKKESFFGKLEVNNNNNKMNKINDKLQDFQCISLSFILFIKAFMSETGNCLEAGYHIYKPPKPKYRYYKGPKKKFEHAIINPLKQIKKEKNDGNIIEIDDGDIFFHYDNFPLQFDLCIIPKNPLNDQEVNDYGLDGKYGDFGVESRQYIAPNDKDSIYKLYGDMVEVFRKVIINKNNIDKEKDKKPIKRRDDRYCIVFNQNINRFYIYPPHINNGDDDAKILHRKQIITKTEEQQQQQIEEEKEENPEGKVRNKYSLIAHEYNDLTNFYLTSKCIIPSKTKGKYYGIDKVDFVLSAHFHKQRQWHRHPKLRIYQYFNGGGLRFFYSNKQINKYKTDKDIVTLWPNYFNNTKTKINDEFIDNLEIFDGVMDLYKCDAQYFQWDNAIKRFVQSQHKKSLLFTGFIKEALKLTKIKFVPNDICHIIFKYIIIVI